jgi:hypothetical protein
MQLPVPLRRLAWATVLVICGADPAFAETFAYGPLGRPIEAAVAGGTSPNAYDAADNRTSATSSGESGLGPAFAARAAPRPIRPAASTPNGVESALLSRPEIQAAITSAVGRSNFGAPNQRDRSEAGFTAYIDDAGALCTIDAVQADPLGYRSITVWQQIPSGIPVLYFHTHPFTPPPPGVSGINWTVGPESRELSDSTMRQAASVIQGPNNQRWYFGV